MLLQVEHIPFENVSFSQDNFDPDPDIRTSAGPSVSPFLRPFIHRRHKSKYIAMVDKKPGRCARGVMLLAARSKIAWNPRMAGQCLILRSLPRIDSILTTTKYPHLTISVYFCTPSHKHIPSILHAHAETRIDWIKFLCI